MISAGHLAWHVHLEQGTETATSNRPQLLGACPRSLASMRQVHVPDSWKVTSAILQMAAAHPDNQAQRQAALPL
jgi:hypothetical protein